ncbi:hypothetical protein ACTOWA_14685 [Herbaspirillum seropedicae]|uniref:hypothetical protein n=1 Tax=Herbaspirillum seropedicae TaxID=964 RepID=UPI003F8D7BBC
MNQTENHVQASPQPAAVYHYHPQTGELTGQSEADASPLEPGRWIVPAFATTIKPPSTGLREIAVWNEDGWQVHADWRGVTLFSTADGSVVVINRISETPPEHNATEQAMPSAAAVWKEGRWHVDPARAAAMLEQARQQRLGAIESLHAQLVQDLLGGPTQMEKDTWALKLEIAAALQSKATLGTAGRAYLESAGLQTEASKMAWAERVLGKSASYGKVLGMAEKLRSQAYAATRGATDERELDAALESYRRACEAARGS